MSLSSIEMWMCDLIVIMYDCVNKVIDMYQLSLTISLFATCKGMPEKAFDL